MSRLHSSIGPLPEQELDPSDTDPEPFKSVYIAHPGHDPITARRCYQCGMPPEEDSFRIHVGHVMNVLYTLLTKRGCSHEVAVATVEKIRSLC